MAAEFSYPTPRRPRPSLRREDVALDGAVAPVDPRVLRLQMELDGEILTKCDPVIGYLHRGDEKIAENMTYNQFVPYTDRLDYIAPLANNMAYASRWSGSRSSRCRPAARPSA